MTKERRKSQLVDAIEQKIAEAKSAPRAKRKHSPSTKAEVNRANAQKSTGPRTNEGKAASATNSLKHGFFANIEKLDHRDAPAFQSTLSDLRIGLHPDDPAEEQLVRELAMFATRLQRLEAIEYALLAGNTEADPSDAREIAKAFLKAASDLEMLHRIEVHLRRAYNRTWTQLDRMQKERNKLSLEESLKRSQVWATYEAQRTNRPQDIPGLHPALALKAEVPKATPDAARPAVGDTKQEKPQQPQEPSANRFKAKPAMSPEENSRNNGEPAKNGPTQ